MEDVSEEILDPPLPEDPEAIPLFPDSWAKELPPPEPPPKQCAIDSEVHDLSNDSDNTESFQHKIFTIEKDPTSVLDPIYTTHNWSYRFAHDPGILNDDIVRYDLPLGLGRNDPMADNINPIFKYTYTPDNIDGSATFYDSTDIATQHDQDSFNTVVMAAIQPQLQIQSDP